MFGNLGKLMKLAGEMKAKMPQMQAKLAASEFAGAAGGGVVTAKVNGRGELVALTIDPQVVADEATDAALLADLVKAAVWGAQQRAAQAAREAMMELTGGVELPGLDGLSGP
jgi:hypothetical protein